MCDVAAVIKLSPCRLCGKNVEQPCYLTGTHCAEWREIGASHNDDIDKTTPEGDIHMVLEHLNGLDDWC